MKRALFLCLSILFLASCVVKPNASGKKTGRAQAKAGAAGQRGPQGGWDRKPGQSGPAATVKIVRSDIRQTMEESGELAAATSADITSRISGRVIRVLVREGAHVSRGQVLAMVEPDAAQARSLSDISDRLANAKMSYDEALQDYEAQKELFEKGFVSADQFRQAEDAFKRSERNYQSCKLEYDSLQRDLGMKDLKVRTLAILAPMSGIVLNRYVEEGEIIAGESTMRSGTKLFTVADLSSLVVKVDVNEVDVYRIEEGLAVSIQVSANPSERYSGRIRKISPYAVNKNGVRMFETEVKFDKPDVRLRPGMTASIRLDIRAKTGVLVAPVTALFLEGEKEYLLAPSSEGPKKIFVERGMADEHNVEIVSGAPEGTVIYGDIPYKELAEKPVFVPEGRK
jgi:HlyD family secretion protein/macrolide-specific efflux system membrane fusion protein